MAGYGVTTQGFNRKRLPEQLQEIFDEIKKHFGEDAPLTIDTVLGLKAYITAERFAAMWEVVEAVYLQMYPMSATGSNLDRAVSFTGVKRLQAEPSSANVVWYGELGTVIPEFSAVKNIRSQVNYYNTEEITISQRIAHDVCLVSAVSKISVGDKLILSINGVRYQYVTDRSSITYAIEKLGLILKGIPYLTVSTDGTELRITADTVRAFELELASGLKLIEIGVVSECETDSASTDLAEAGELSGIVTTQNGLARVVNLITGTSGRFEESDSELYARYHLGVYHAGAGTSESLLANLLEVSGVKEVFVYENDQNTADSYGTPANSLHCIVKGGLDSDVARTILAFKPAGIPTFGTTTVSVKDSQNFNKTIHFSRPKRKYIWVKVVASTFVDQTEYAKSGYIVNLANAIMEYGATLSVGADVILQRIVGKCVEIEGIGKVEISLGITNNLTDPEPRYSAENITIAPNEEAFFDKSLIVIG